MNTIDLYGNYVIITSIDGTEFRFPINSSTCDVIKRDKYKLFVLKNDTTKYEIRFPIVEIEWQNKNNVPYTINTLATFLNKNTAWINTSSLEDLELKEDKLLPANTIRANNTASTANSQAFVFKQSGQKVLPFANLAFTAGTAPSGTYNGTYNWEQIGNKVTYYYSIVFSVAGATVTQLTIAFPSDLPAPVIPTGFETALDRIILGSGQFATNKTLSAQVVNLTSIRRTAGGVWQTNSIQVSGAHRVFYGSFIYFTS